MSSNQAINAAFRNGRRGLRLALAYASKRRAHQAAAAEEAAANDASTPPPTGRQKLAARVRAAITTTEGESNVR